MIEIAAAGIGALSLLANGAIWYKLGSLEKGFSRLQEDLRSITKLTVSGGKRDGKRRLEN